MADATFAHPGAQAVAGRFPALAYYTSAFAAYLGHSVFTYGLIIHAHARSPDPALASMLFLAMCAPIVAFGAFGGVLSDRHPRKKLLLLAQAAAVVFLFAFLLQAGLGLGDRRFAVAAIVFLYGTAVAFTPAPRISLAFDVFSSQGVEKATTIVKVLNTLAFGIGPFLGGALRGHSGWAVFFMVPIACMLVSNALLVALPNDRSRETRKRSAGWAGELRQGLAYIAGDPRLAQIFMLCAFLYTLLLGTYQVLIPAYAKDCLMLGEVQRGIFLAGFGMSLLTGGIAATLLGAGSRRGAWMIAGAGASTAFFLGIAAAKSLAMASVCLAGAGLFGGLFAGLAPSALQALTPDGLRGRVMSLYYVLLAGTPALGGVIFGAVAKHAGLRSAIFSAGAAGLAVFAAAALASRALRKYA